MSKALIYTAFHLNLAFSSIEEDQRKTVVEKCYWPLLRLAQEGFPVGIEATSYTLQEIKRCDPEWISVFRRLLAEGNAELIGSGYTQMIAPLVPFGVTEANLRLGLQDYEDITGVRPRIAMVNEQAYSPGLVPLYLDAGFDAIIMDWSEPSSHNRSWSKKYAGRPQLVLGSEGLEIPVVWSDALSFQKFQRYAHAEIEADEYFEFLGFQLENEPVAFPLYTSDAEVFDYRPGRFAGEAVKTGAVKEYERIALLLRALKGSDAVELGTPSDALARLDRSGSAIRLETAQAPVPVKKQRKYNVLRWGATGRNDLAVNTACHRILEGFEKHGPPTEVQWRRVCELWASDFRTHITENRWQAFLNAEEWTAAHYQGPLTEDTQRADGRDSGISVSRQGRFLVLETSGQHIVLNCRRGLSIQSFGPGGYDPGRGAAPASNGLVGTLAHGFFEDIAFGADFYSGHFVFEPSERHKITDLLQVEPEVFWRPDQGALDVVAKMEIDGHPVTKTVRFFKDQKKITIWYNGELLTNGAGTFRCAYLTLNPYAFDARSLYFKGRNGGRSHETHQLWDAGIIEVDHGAAVSRLVSATTGLGLTDGILELGDSRSFLRLKMDRTDAAGLGLVKSTPVGESYFVRAAITLRESDETSRTQTANTHAELPAPAIRYSIEFGTHDGS